MRLLAAAALLVAGLASSPASAQSPDPHRDDWLAARWVVEGGFVMLRTEQQVKAEIGGRGATALVNDVQLASGVFATARVWRFLRLGLFATFDVGRRSSATFEGLDDEGTATTVSLGGGPFTETWVGPLVQLRWRYLFGEAGWGAVAFRQDDGRGDLTAPGTSGAFRASPRVAWMLGAGGYFPIYGAWDLMLRVTYRIRYYETRGGDDLASGVAFGQQTITPLVGITWRH